MALHVVFCNEGSSYFGQHKFPSSWQKLGFPTRKFTLNFLHNKIKSTAHSTLVYDREPQVLTKIIGSIDSQLFANISLPSPSDIQGKEYPRFSMIHLLPSQVAKVVQDLQDGFTILSICLSKQHEVVRKNTCEKLGRFLDALTLSHLLSSHILVIWAPRNSMHNRKKYSVIGSPCLILLESWKDSSLGLKLRRREQ